MAPSWLLAVCLWLVSAMPWHVAAPATTTHVSQLTWAACSKSGYQLFAIEAPDGMGMIKDSKTGRCLTVRSCDAAALSKEYEAVQLDECGAADRCDGKAQQWKATPIAGRRKTYLLTSAVGSGAEFCLNAVSDKSATEGFELIVWRGCSADETNEQWVVTPLSQLKTNDPAKAAAPCLQARECVAPCELSGAWGLTFLAVFGTLLAVYVGVGAAYGVKAQGKSLRQDGVIGVLPQADCFMALRGLVEDGCNWTVDMYVRMSSGRSRRTIYANAAGFEERRFSAPGVSRYGATTAGSDDAQDTLISESADAGEPKAAGRVSAEGGDRPPRTKSDDV
jgi:hypothetical protein